MKTPVIIPAALLLGLSAGIVGAEELPYRGEGHLILGADQLQWTDIASLPAPAQMAVIEGDLAKSEPFTFRLKLPANYRLEPHSHPAYERVTVLSGTLHFAHGETFDREKTQPLRAGDIAIMPPGAPMFGYTEEETVVQLQGIGPWGIDYLNPADDPRK
jgi:hypothetical protein